MDMVLLLLPCRLHPCGRTSTLQRILRAELQSWDVSTRKPAKAQSKGLCYSYPEAPRPQWFGGLKLC